MFPDILHIKHGPTLFLLTSDFTFVLIHAMAQRLEHHGMSASQIIFFRFVSILSRFNPLATLTGSCPAAQAALSLCQAQRQLPSAT